MQSKVIPKLKKKIFVGIALLIVIFIAMSPLKRAAWELYLSADVYEAIKAGNADDVATLLQKGANPNRDGAGGLMGGTPLMWATGNSDLKIMRVLIKGGANLNQKTNGGYTALMQAPSPQAAQLLLNAGADPNVRNDSGKTAWQCAKDNHLPRVADMIKRVQAKR